MANFDLVTFTEKPSKLECRNDNIRPVCNWMIGHLYYAKVIVQRWLDVIQSERNPDRIIALLCVVNEILRISQYRKLPYVEHFLVPLNKAMYAAVHCLSLPQFRVFNPILSIWFSLPNVSISGLTSNLVLRVTSSDYFGGAFGEHEQAGPSHIPSYDEILFLHVQLSADDLKNVPLAVEVCLTLFKNSVPTGYVLDADQCLFSRPEKNGGRTYVLLYVDDILVVGATSEMTKKVGRQLDKFFRTKDLGDVTNYLGIQIEREGDGSFLLHQQRKIDLMLEQHGMLDCKPAATPMEVGSLSMNEESAAMEDNAQYRQVVGSLLYIATVSRPDITMAVGLLCRHVETPTLADWKSVKRVIRYLSGTKHVKLRLCSSTNLEPQCYVDADWAGDKLDRKSTTGYVFKLGNCTISWASHKQSTVALSSTEAEYIAASHTCRELLWLRQLLQDLSMPADGPIVIFEDNQACIKLVDSNRCNARTKHIDVCHHHVRDLRIQDIITLRYCPSSDMLADIFTKPLSKDSFIRFRKLLGLEG
uniref:Reverse transcriptase Ty1/copia-type domain-containing protein n=1 Tax=Trichuris muris TaxID=70415 RepID=A0A5S6QRU0_TRIMR